MALDSKHERHELHLLLDLLPTERLGEVRDYLEDMVDDDLDAADHASTEARAASLKNDGGVPMEEVLADFGLTTADFEGMGDEPDPHSVG